MFPRGGAPYLPTRPAAARRPQPKAPPKTDQPLPPEAQRALQEAEARRKARKGLDLPPEKGGRPGPEPVRFGDWEKDGRAIDF